MIHPGRPPVGRRGGGGTRNMKGGCNMENPEVEFLQYLLNRYIKSYGLDPSSLTVAELLDNINLNLTPIGGG